MDSIGKRLLDTLTFKRPEKEQRWECLLCRGMSTERHAAHKPSCPAKQAADVADAAAHVVVGWREIDWPEGFDRRTAKLISDEFERRSVARKEMGDGNA